MSDEIVVAIKGTNYGGWKAATVTRSIDSMCGSFEVSAADKWNQSGTPLEIQPGDSCQVLLGGEPVITGYIDKVSLGISSDEHSLDVSGRDKTCDLVDCSAEIPSFELHGQNLAGIAGMLCKDFSVALRVETDVGDPWEHFSIQVGETAFACIERAAKQRGVLCTTDGDGALVLSARGQFKSAGDTLIEGKNIKTGTREKDWSNRYRDYTTHGQMPALKDGADDPCCDQIGKARDMNVMRYRPLLVTCEAWSDCKSAKSRAENECAYRAGKSFRVNIRVAGWRQSDGSLWVPGLKTTVSSPSLYLDNEELVISTVRYTVSSESGIEAELEMTKPDAYLESCAGEVEEDPVE